MSPKMIGGLIAVLIAVILIFSSFFTVYQGQTAMALRLGSIEKNAKGEPKTYGPGLHFKTPFIVNIRKYDTLLQDLEDKSPRILTQEQKYLYVDYYAKWRIKDLALYYTRTGGYSENAKQLLTQKINEVLRAQFGKRNLQEVVADQRSDIMGFLKESANTVAQGLGLEIVDVRIKSIDLMPDVQDSVFKSMSTKREQDATGYRSSGVAEAERIRAEADATAVKIIADANLTAAQLRAKGDEEAANIYTTAYKQDPEFYALYRSLESYREVFSNNRAIMVLKPDSPYFKYFQQANLSVEKHG
ncbi:MAG: protease modulator HflC [Proteobacteria bacterium]|nr:protease modulator HflC [Pseudomonadota bacterium]